MKIVEDFKASLESMLDVPTLYKISICLPDAMDAIYEIPHNDSDASIIEAFRKAYNNQVVISDDFRYVGFDDNSGSYHVDGSEVDSVFESVKAMTIKDLYEALKADDHINLDEDCDIIYIKLI